jgi:HD-like signal output (HDOD) protein
MDAWDMPKEIVEAVAEHHNPQHCGDYSVFSNVVFIANALLKRIGIGDAESSEVPQALLERFALDEEKLEQALASVLEGRDGLEFMATKMAA